jgi:hypothetical protein
MCSRPFRPLGFAHLCRSRPRGSIHSLLPSQLYLDHSHCPVLAPATLAALPSTRAIETRLLPSSLAATHRGFAFYVARPTRSIPSLAACSMSENSFETRSRARFDSCAPAHFRPLGLPIYVAGFPAAPFSPLPVAALPAISKFPFPQFLD